MVRLCFALLLLRKEQDGIDMQRGLMDDLEGEVIGEEVHDGGFSRSHGAPCGHSLDRVDIWISRTHYAM
jgi:hypothetical protein